MFIFGVIFALVAGILFGLIGPTTKIAYNSGASVALTIFLRYAVASIIILPFIPYQNNLLEIFQEFAEGIQFLHLRSTKRDDKGNFYEANHLEGDFDMFEVVRAILIEEQKRKKGNR